MSVRLTSVLILALSLPPFVSAENDLTVQDASIREAPPGASALAGYMVIENDSAKPRRLIAAESPAFKTIELHRSWFEDGLARMAPQTSIEIPVGGQVALAPGSYHLMLLAPTRPLRAGDQVDIRLAFDGNEHLNVRLPVRKAAAVEHHHH